MSQINQFPSVGANNNEGSAQSTKTVMNRLKAPFIQTIKTTSLQATLCFVFFIPDLLNKHDYLLPIIWISIPVVGYKIANVTQCGKPITSLISRYFFKSKIENSSTMLSNPKATKNMVTNLGSSQNNKISQT